MQAQRWADALAWTYALAFILQADLHFMSSGLGNQPGCSLCAAYQVQSSCGKVTTWNHGNGSADC